jgi:hypothetical protein
MHDQSRIETLEGQVAALLSSRVRDANRIRLLEKIIDTWNTPLWKRIWFVIQGYRFRRLGVWYRARWNQDGWNY